MEVLNPSSPGDVVLGSWFGYDIGYCTWDLSMPEFDVDPRTLWVR